MVWDQRERHTGLPGLLVCPTIRQAKEAQAVLMTRRVRCAYFDGTTPQSQINEEMASIRAGEVDILLLCKKGQLGMDLPNLGFVMLPWGVKSVVPFLQVVGRVVRKWPGKEEARVYLWGDAPAVKRGHYKRMLDYALKVKEDPEGPAAGLSEELEFLEYHEVRDNERIAWTKDAIAACKALAAGGFPGVAAILESKKFPQKYARALKRIVSEMESGGVDGPSSGPSSDLQRRLLREYRFDSESIESMDKHEASLVIAGMKKYLHRGPFIIPRGPYAGKHFSETPSLYRAKMKDQVVRQIFRAWVQAGRPGKDD